MALMILLHRRAGFVHISSGGVRVTSGLGFEQIAYCYSAGVCIREDWRGYNRPPEPVYEYQ